jgi:hypothetical protein
LKHECHTKIAVWLKQCSPKASQSISGVLVEDLPSFTQNLMQTSCLILPSIADKTKQEVKKAQSGNFPIAPGMQKYVANMDDFEKDFLHLFSDFLMRETFLLNVVCFHHQNSCKRV